MLPALLTLTLLVVSVHSHGTQIVRCRTSDGSLRIFVEHWHGYHTDFADGSVMVVRDDISGVSSNLKPTPVNDVQRIALPGCIDTPQVVSACTGRADLYNDWGYYTFPVSCNTQTSISILSGTDWTFMKACTELYPTTIQDSFTDISGPEFYINDVPCSQAPVVNICESDFVDPNATPDLFKIELKDDCDPNPTITEWQFSSATADIDTYNYGCQTVWAKGKDSMDREGVCSFQVCKWGCDNMEIEAEITQTSQCSTSADIDLEISGATEPYTFQWSNGATTQDAQVGLGTTSVTVTESKCNCQATESFTISDPTFTVSVTVDSQVSCNGGSNGAATAQVSGGDPSAQYQFKWDGGVVSSSNQNQQLSAGVHTVTAISSSGCSRSTSFRIAEPPALEATAAVDSHVSCYGNGDGSASATATGGTAPYTFAWSDGSTGNSAGNLIAGDYHVTVTDANGCIDESSSVAVSQPVALTFSTDIEVPNKCHGASEGEIEVGAAGGTPAYSFAWSSTNGVAIADDTLKAQNLPAGTYTVVVTDQNQCSESRTFTLTDPPALDIHNVKVKDNKCHGDAKGKIKVCTSGGTGELSYQWDDPEGQTKEDAKNLPAGTYTLTVTDENGCVATHTATVAEPDPLVVVAEASKTLVFADVCGDDNQCTQLSASGTLDRGHLTWSAGDTVIGSDQSFQYCADSDLDDGDFHSSTRFTVTLTDHDNCKCSVSSYVDVCVENIRCINSDKPSKKAIQICEESDDVLYDTCILYNKLKKRVKKNKMPDVWWKASCQFDPRTWVCDLSGGNVNATSVLAQQEESMM